MCGAVICSILSDKFGRKPIFLISHWAMVIVGVANAFAPNYYAFSVLRFFSGMVTHVRTTAVQFVGIRRIPRVGRAGKGIRGALGYTQLRDPNLLFFYHRHRLPTFRVRGIIIIIIIIII